VLRGIRKKHKKAECQSDRFCSALAWQRVSPRELPCLQVPEETSGTSSLLPFPPQPKLEFHLVSVIYERYTLAWQNLG
jgi:hypothetical protein